MSARRRPVPREWREEHHELDVQTRSWGGGRGHQYTRVSRSRGYCSCGANFPFSATADNYDAKAVREAWKDHVEQAYYATRDAMAVDDPFGTLNAKGY